MVAADANFLFRHGRPTRRWEVTLRYFRHSRRCAAGSSAGAMEVSAGTFRTFR
jgi:hypothetical protein